MRIKENKFSVTTLITYITLTAVGVLYTRAPAPLAIAQHPIFVDVTEEAGIHFKHTSGKTEHKHIIETMGSGAVFFDYDNDGHTDLYFVNSGPVPNPVPNKTLSKTKQSTTSIADNAKEREGTNSPVRTHAIDRKTPDPNANALYRNEGNGQFTDVTEISGTGDTGYGMAAAAGDIDNDGHAELYVANFGPDTLYRNNGDGTFTDITESAGIDNQSWGIAVVYLDFNRDGHLDIFVVNYLVYDVSMPVETYKGIVGYGHPRRYRGTADVLYRNNGDGTFTDVAAQAGVTNPEEGRGMAAVACDYDNDGFPDIYVTNDTNRNFLYRNNGDGTFTDESLFIGAGYDENGVAEGSMGVDCGDYNGDGWLDLVIANSEKATLYKNEEGIFTDATVASGLQQPTLPFVGFSPLFLDYDNDGHLDIFCANGHPQDVIEILQDHETYAQRAQLFRNNGDGTYRDVSETAGTYFSEARVGRAAASADYDNDGDVDIIVMNSNQRPVLLRNETRKTPPAPVAQGKPVPRIGNVEIDNPQESHIVNPNPLYPGHPGHPGHPAQNWLGIELVGTRSNRDGIGAKVTIIAGGIPQVAETKSGSSYASGSDTRLLFGVGEQQRVETIAVTWPSGITQELAGVEVNQTVTISEPER